MDNIQVYYNMVEYLYGICVNRKSKRLNSVICIVALGTSTYHVVVILSDSLNVNGYSSKFTFDGQLTRLVRLSCGENKIGILHTYSYLCPTTATENVFREGLEIQGSDQWCRSLNIMSDSGNSTISMVHKKSYHRAVASAYIFY